MNAIKYKIRFCQWNNFPVGMELFSASNTDQWSIIQKTIDSSDYYVLIIGYMKSSAAKEENDSTNAENEQLKKELAQLKEQAKKANYALSRENRDLKASWRRQGRKQRRWRRSFPTSGKSCSTSRLRLPKKSRKIQKSNSHITRPAD